MSKTTQLITFFILFCLLTVACSRTEINESEDVVDEVHEGTLSLPTAVSHTGTTESGDVLYEIHGVTLPLPAITVISKQDITGGNNSARYILETDMPVQEVITYINLSWPLSGTAGFVETTPSGRVYGRDHIHMRYDGAFKNGETHLLLSVEEGTTIEANETTRKTVILIFDSKSSPEATTDDLERIPLALTDHDIETTWETVPLPEGRVDEDKGEHNKHIVRVDQPAMAVIQQINEAWAAADLNGAIDANDSAHGYGFIEDGVVGEYQVYLGQFKKDEVTYYVEVQQWENVTDTAEFTDVHITPQWTVPAVDFDALLPPDTNVMEARPIWLLFPVYPGEVLGKSFILDMPSDHMITFINERWRDEGLNGNIEPQPHGRWVSYDPHAEQSYYQGRFDDMDHDVAYIVRVYDIAGEEKAAVSIIALVTAHADHLGY